MARRSNFDDSELQKALEVAKRQFPKAGMKGYRAAAVVFVETAKKFTKLASRARIVRDYQKSGVAIREAEGDKAKAQREIDKRIGAIGYVRKGWKITRVTKAVITIENTARNSRFIANARRAGTRAARETKKAIPGLVAVEQQKVARRISGNYR